MAPKPRRPIDRFSEKTKPLPNGCIEWVAYVGENGYGRFYINGRGALAHRWSYEFHVGPIPDGLVIDHLCRNRACVNPSHLEPVPQSANVQRGNGPALRVERALAATHCPNGHPYLERGECRTCKKDRAREYYERNRELVIARSRARRLAKSEVA